MCTSMCSMLCVCVCVLYVRGTSLEHAVKWRNYDGETEIEKGSREREGRERERDN